MSQPLMQIAPMAGAPPVEETRRRMLAGIAPLGTEQVALREALGRTLAAPVPAGRDQPPFDVSAMDGYAIPRAATLNTDFAVIADSAAGHPWRGTVTPGQSVRVFTGAAVPPGCRVIVQERARREGDRVRFEEHQPSSDNVRAQGGDFTAGGVLLEAGQRLDAWRIGLAAAAGQGTVMVHTRPRIAILPTGDEIVAGGDSGTHDSNGPALAARIIDWGGVPIPLPPVPDSEGRIAAAVEGAACDLLVIVGGASVGDHDRVKPALRHGGLALLVEKVALRPGKPTWFGRYADRLPVLGLPGNPAAALTCAELFLRPLVRALQGGDTALRLDRAILRAPVKPGGPAEHWLRATWAADGPVLTARPFDNQDTASVAIFARATCLIRRPVGAPRAAPGDEVEILRLDRLDDA